MGNKSIKRNLKRFWKFFWEEDSLLSWILNIIVAFVLIKFVVYPIIGFALGTGFPIVAVVSGSMEHKIAPVCSSLGCEYKYCDNTYDEEAFKAEKDKDDYANFDYFWKQCGDWYENIGLKKQDFNAYPMHNGFNTGDIIFLRGIDPEKIEVGDIIVFNYNTKLSYPVIHRVVSKKYEKNEYFFQTKGDHNQMSDPINEYNISEDRIIGKAIFRIPYIGWIKIWFFKAISPILALFGLQVA